MKVCVLVLMLLSAGAWAQDLPRNYALVIGINRYVSSIEGVPQLKYAVNDAKAVRTALEQQNYDVIPITDTVARRENIITELVNLAYTTKETDSVLIYFAGHGVRHKIGAREHSYWLTYDTTLPRLEVEGLRLTHLLDYVNDIPARRKILILDHCHSGDVEFRNVALNAGARGVESSLAVARNLFSESLFSEQIQNHTEGLVVIGAATDNAYEFPDLGHGIFTHVLLQALTTPKADSDSDGKLSVNELRDYLPEQVRQLAAERSIPQQPIEVVRGTNLNWILADIGSIIDELKQLLGQLEVRGNLDTLISLKAFQAIDSWDTDKQSGIEPKLRDARIVSKLRDIREIGNGASWPIKAQMLTLFINALEQS